MNAHIGMSTGLDLAAVARAMKAAQDEARQLAPWTTRFTGFDLTAAYVVAEWIDAARRADGAIPVGRKIGLTNPDMWVRYGVRQPIWGPMYDSTVMQVEDGTAVCSLEGCVEPKIEPEIVLHFHCAPPVTDELDAVLDAVDWVANGFEIVQSHYPGWSFEAADTVADAALHARLLLGEPRAVSDLGPDSVQALAGLSLALCCDGHVRTVGRGSNVLGSPLAAVAHLAALLQRQPDFAPPQAGEWVSTGTITTAQPVRAGQVWHAEIQGISLPGLTVHFTD
jgi:2-oxo-3-hexenedioate decarboxylase